MLALAYMGLELGLRPGERNGLWLAAADDLATNDFRLAGSVSGRDRSFRTALLTDELWLEHMAALDTVTNVVATYATKTFDLYVLQVFLQFTC